MTYDDLLAHYGSQGAIARALNLAQPSVWSWQSSGVPLGRQAQFELITNGALKAELPKPADNTTAARVA